LAQRLFVRLCKRKGPWFQVAKLQDRYCEELPDVAALASELCTAGLLAFACQSSQETSIESANQIAEVLTVPQLKAILAECSQSKPGGSTNRAALLDALRKALKPQKGRGSLSQWLGGTKRCSSTTAIDALKRVAGDVLRLPEAVRRLWHRVELLFFLNAPPEAFVLSRMGMWRFVAYPCQPSTIFASRAALCEYEQARALYDELCAALEANPPRDQEGSTTRLALRCIEEAASWLRARGGIEDCVQCRAAFPLRACQCDYGAERAAGRMPEAHDEQPFLRRFSARWIYCQLAWHGVKVLEAPCHRHEEAVSWLRYLLQGHDCPGKRGRWWERLTINLHTHLQRHDEAIAACQAALADNWLRASERGAIAKRLHKICKAKRRGIPLGVRVPPQLRWRETVIYGKPINCRAGQKSVFYGYDDQLCSVEELALQHYAGEGEGIAEEEAWTGLHSEGRIWGILFGLLLWDVIFAPVPHVFQTPFQVCPLDMDTEAFYTSRSPTIQQCCKGLQMAGQEGGIPSLREAVRVAWDAHHGEMCRGVQWDLYPVEVLEAVAECTGGKVLAHMFDLLARDYAHWHRGLPDLVLWRDDGRAKLVEVKGPRDRLSDIQCAWLHELVACGMDVEVLHVQEHRK